MNRIVHAENLLFLEQQPDASVNLVYIDPPFNTGRRQRLGNMSYEDAFSDYHDFLRPRLVEALRVLTAAGSLFVHLDYREAHYVKVLLDQLLGRECFMNEIIWAYDYGGRSKRKWSAKHDSILWYAKDPKNYTFNFEEMDRIPYMAPGLVGKEKAARGKTPTDCFTPDTDVLTSEGWVPISSVTKAHMVATVSPDRDLSYEQPIALQKKRYVGDLVRFASRDMDVLVTPGHNMYVRKRGYDAYTFMRADSVPACARFLNQTQYDGESGAPTEFVVPDYKCGKRGRRHPAISPVPIDVWCKFIGYYLAEGSYRENVVNITKSRTKSSQWDDVATVLDAMGLSWKYYDSSLSFVIYNRQLMLYVSQFGKSHEKYIPRDLLMLPGDLLRGLWAILLRCDGALNGNSEAYYTTSPRLANDVQELLFKIGFKSNIFKLAAREGKKQLYRVAKKKFAESVVKEQHISRVGYTGNVFCLTLPTHHTVVIRRNGRLAICGQCWWHTIVPTNGKERTGYPTQKPRGIMDRIIKVHSNLGDVVLDFFAGSGTTGESAATHGREFVLVDSNREAIEVMTVRLAFAQPTVECC